MWTKSNACLGVFAVALSACQATAPVVETSTPNVIAVSYNAYGETPTLTPEALDLAIKHCKAQGGLYANYRGASAPNPLSTKEVHTFACERTKTDDNAVIAAQNQLYSARAADMAAGISAAFEQATPTYTNCTTTGYQTLCTSY